MTMQWTFTVLIMNELSCERPAMNSQMKVKRVLCYMAVSLMFAVTARAGENMLTNPGFEEGELDWRTSFGGDLPKPPGMFRLHRGIKASGRFAAAIRKRAIDKPYADWWRFVPVEKDQGYRVTFSYRTNKTFKGEAVVMIHGCGLNYHRRRMPGTLSKWRTAQLYFTPKASGKVYLQLQNMGKGSIWYDDIVLEKMSPKEMSGKIIDTKPGENILSNPGFEQDFDANNSPDDWLEDFASYTADPPPGTFKWDFITRESGNYSVMIHKEPGEKRKAGWWRYFPVEKASYQLTFSYKTDPKFTGKATGFIHAVYKDKKPASELHTPLAVPSIDWKKVQLPFTSTGAGKISIQLLNNGAGSIWFDNVTLTKTSPLAVSD